MSKRKTPDDGNADEIHKLAKLEECNNNSTEEDSLNIGSNTSATNEFNLADFSDDVLLIILKQLHPFDLANFSKTSERFNILCRDRTIWTDIDFRYDPDEGLYNKEIINFDQFFKFILPTTRSIKKSGHLLPEHVVGSLLECTNQTYISQSFLQKLKEIATSLKEFVLEDHVIFGSSIQLSDFPQTIERLSLINCNLHYLIKDRSWFRNIDADLPNLTVLNLSGCLWFRSHSFLAISKCSNLKELYLRKCINIEDCVPYASLAANFGFKKLEVLDLSLTKLTDSDICCFNRLKNLRELHLQAVLPNDDDKITDISVTSFGNGRFVNTNMINIAMAIIYRQENRLEISNLEVLVLKDYRLVTDISLKHAASCLPKLKYLDVRGTCCSISGIRTFKQSRPDVRLLNNFSDDIISVEGGSQTS